MHMTTPAHILIGAVAAKIIVSNHLIPGSPAVIYAAGILFSNIPDLDVFFLKPEKRWHHRTKSIAHFPIVWAVLFTLAAIFLKPLCGPVFYGYLSFSIIMVAAHFVLDTMTGNVGVCWLAPFVRKEISVFPIGEKQATVGLFVREYVKKKAFKFEVFLWIICLLYLLLHRN